MATTLSVESFSSTNIHERSRLTQGTNVGSAMLQIEDTQGLNGGDIIYVGELSREGCEKAVIQSVSGGTTLSLAAPLALPHNRFDAVTSVLGDLIHVYRAANIDGRVPASGAFSVLATRNIDPDQLSTYFTDSSGDSNFWYGLTYYNATTLAETSLDDSVKRRGDDFGHYASLTEIRRGAGFENNYNVKDTYLDQIRMAAEAEVNTSLATSFTTPFTPVPDFINAVTIALAVGLIWVDEYGNGSTKAKDKLASARVMITGLQNRSSDLTDENGVSLSNDGLSYWPDDTVPRPFFIGDRF